MKANRLRACDRHHALRQKFAQLVFDLLRLPIVCQRLGPHGSQSQSSIGGAQQNRCPVETASSLIKLCDGRTLKNSWEENALCRVMPAQTKASLFSEKLCEQQLFTMKRLFVFLNSRIFQAKGAFDFEELTVSLKR